MRATHLTAAPGLAVTYAGSLHVATGTLSAAERAEVASSLKRYPAWVPLLANEAKALRADETSVG